MKRIAVRITLALLIVFLLGSCSAKEEDEGYQQITMEEAISAMASETDYILLDVRTVDEYKEEHIVGAINIPNEDIGTEEIVALLDKEQKIFVYCRSGNRSKKAAAKLAALGYENVIEIGGIIDYTGETVSGE